MTRNAASVPCESHSAAVFQLTQGKAFIGQAIHGFLSIGPRRLRREIRSTGVTPRSSRRDLPVRRRRLSTESIPLSQSQVVRAPVFRHPHPSLYGVRGFTKRTLDVALAGLGLLVLSPFLLLVALLVKLDSPGPALFKQRRVGLNGREFWMYKFRSMVVDAEQQLETLKNLNEVKDGVTFKIVNDPRMTRLGRILRKTSLDEFPQLFNVIMGEMSLVGPRPPLPKEVAHYSSEQKRRLTVVPGCTGLWQISGRSKTTFTKMVELDLKYIETWSFSQDLFILFKTIQVILKMEGSY